MTPSSFSEPHAQSIGPYEVLLDIGSGGMGTISLARATGEPVGVGGFTRLVALKRPHGALASDPEVLRRFLDEARLLAQVHHANVIGIHQIGSDGGGHFLVLDYVEGGTLDELMTHVILRRKKLAPPVVLRIVSDVLAGLHAVHEAVDAAGQPLRMLHRDVSSQNVLVGRDGVARLADFGIAKAITSSTVTDKAYLQGRVPYMAPEYLRRESVDRRLDVYAMGVTLWSAIAGDLPWPDASEAQIVHHVVHGGIPPLSAAGVVVAPAIEALVSRACDSDVGRRFATAREMLDAIEELGRHTGWIASHAEVAAIVDELLGRDLAARRAAIAGRVSSPHSRPVASSVEARGGQVRGSGAVQADVSGGVRGSGAVQADATGVVQASVSRAGTTSAAARGRKGMALGVVLVAALGALAAAWRWSGGADAGSPVVTDAEASPATASALPVALFSAAPVATATVSSGVEPSPSAPPSQAPTRAAVAPAIPPQKPVPARPGTTPAGLPTGITTANPYR